MIGDEKDRRESNRGTEYLRCLTQSQAPGLGQTSYTHAHTHACTHARTRSCTHSRTLSPYTLCLPHTPTPRRPPHRPPLFAHTHAHTHAHMLTHTCSRTHTCSP